MTATVLLVEDKPGDQKLIERCLRDRSVANDVHIVDSGEEALDFLYHRGKCGNTPSDSHEDILDSYKLHANGYLKKPVDLPELRNVVEGVGEYRFAICKRPPKGR